MLKDTNRVVHFFEVGKFRPTVEYPHIGHWEWHIKKIFLAQWGVGTADFLNFNKNHKIDPLWDFCFWHLKFGIKIWPKYQNPMYTSIKSPQRWNFWFFWIFPIFSGCGKWNRTLPPEHHENKYFLSFSPLGLLGQYL